MSESEGEKARVLIVDDHPIVRHGLALLIDEQADLKVCAQAESREEALAALEESRPDIALVDLSLGEESGLDLIKDLLGRRADLPVLVVSIHSEEVYAERALRAGAKGYVAKQEAITDLLQAIRKVLQGEVYTSEKVTSRLLKKLSGQDELEGSPVDKLTNRELHVFQMLGKGHTTREVAELLDLSVKTIDTYRARIKSKLGMKHATELVQHALRWVQEQGIE